MIRNTVVILAVAVVLFSAGSGRADSIRPSYQSQRLELSHHRAGIVFSAERTGGFELHDVLLGFRSNPIAANTDIGPAGKRTPFTMPVDDFPGASSLLAGAHFGESFHESSIRCLEGAPGPSPSPVPESSTALLLGIGAAGLSCLGRFSRKILN